MGDDDSGSSEGGRPAPAGGAVSQRGRQIATVARLRAVMSCPPKGVPEKLGDRPLRLILIGHNPSAHAWYVPAEARAVRVWGSDRAQP